MLLPYAMAAAEEARTDGSDSNDGNDAFNVDVGWNVVHPCCFVPRQK